jgi:hypothetical protein
MIIIIKTRTIISRIKKNQIRKINKLKKIRKLII